MFFRESGVGFRLASLIISSFLSIDENALDWVCG
jgi:hypothetical protein